MRQIFYTLQGNQNFVKHIKNIQVRGGYLSLLLNKKLHLFFFVKIIFLINISLVYLSKHKVFNWNYCLFLNKILYDCYMNMCD